MDGPSAIRNLKNLIAEYVGDVNPLTGAWCFSLESRGKGHCCHRLSVKMNRTAKPGHYRINQ
jgi:hypothetical protein